MYFNTTSGTIPNAEKNKIEYAFYNNSFTFAEYHKTINDQLWEARNGENKSWIKARNLEKIIK